MNIDPQILRKALGQFATGVTVITTRGCEGQAVGVTASSFNTLSLDPPLVLWSIARSALSFSAFAEGESFAVHVLGENHQELSNRFARPGTDKFADLELEQGIDDLPLLPECIVRFQCKTEYRYEGGDHLILVGRVMQIDCEACEQPPLVFHASRYARLAPTPMPA